MTATVTKGKGLWSIAKENGVKVSDLYKANPGLESMQKKGNIPKNYEIKIPTKSQTNTSKLKPQSTSKKNVKKQAGAKPKKKVVNESKSTKKCKCVSPSWMLIAKEEMNKKVQRYYGFKTHNIQSIKFNNCKVNACSNPEISKYHAVSGLGSPFKEKDCRQLFLNVKRDCNLIKKSGRSNSNERQSWCGSFINWTLLNTKDERINKDLKHVYVKGKAIHWALFGKKVMTPIYGAIAVKSRGSKRKRISKDSPIWIRRIRKLEKKGRYIKAKQMAESDYTGSGHVGFVMGVDKWPNPEYIYILGGNQWGYSNTINWGNKGIKNNKSYIKSVLFPSRYKIKDWNIGFFVPSYYCTSQCIPKIYNGKFIIALGDGN